MYLKAELVELGGDGVDGGDAAALLLAHVAQLVVEGEQVRRVRLIQLGLENVAASIRVSTMRNMSGKIK